MRSSAALLFCLLVVQPLTRAEIKTENHILILTDENFDEAIKNHMFISVHYLPTDNLAAELWSPHAAAYDKAALDLAGEKSELKLAKVICTNKTEIKVCRDVLYFPRLMFFRDGEPVGYLGSGTTSDLILWLKQNSAPPAEISTPEGLTAFKEARKFVVIGFFKDRESDAAKAFLKPAAGNDAMFGISSDDAVFAAAEAEDGQVVLFKKYDEGRNVLEKVGTAEQVREFVAVYSLPLVIDAFEPLYEIYGRSTRIEMYLFIDKRNADFEKIYANYRESAKQCRGRAVFMMFGSDYSNYPRILHLMGLKESETPRIRIFRRPDSTKFKRQNETDFEPAAISEFVRAVVHGQIKPYFVSQDLPEDWDKAPVKVLVRTNFDEIAFDKSKNVLVMFYDPNDDRSEKLVQILDRLGEHFRNDGQVVIAKIDAWNNELEHDMIGWGIYATLNLYKKNTNEVIEYGGERTFEGLKKFIESNSDHGMRCTLRSIIKSVFFDRLLFFRFGLAE